MKNSAKFRWFLAAAVAAAMLPTLHSLFRHKDILPVHGYQKVETVPKPTWKAFRTRQYQGAFEKRFAKRFFLRGLMYRTRCQVMELLNLGTFHESYLQNIGQFGDGSLFEYSYFHVYHGPQFAATSKSAGKSLKAIGRLGKALASNGVDMVFVMAADKVQMTREPMPWPTSRLFKRRASEFQTEFGRLLADNGIPAFDTYLFLTNEAPRHSGQMFPYAGSHWNALASSLVVEELLKRLNGNAGRRYSINHVTGVRNTDIRPAPFMDDDIGELLNLLCNPYLKKNKCLVPTFEDDDFTPNEGSVIVFGDSFSDQIAETMREARLFAPGKILHCDKGLPSADELDGIVPDLRLVVFVYVTPNMLRMDKLPHVGGLVLPFCEALAEKIAMYPGLSYNSY